jgi:TalC/MipB family fructose-6-phosphate aldolase
MELILDTADATAVKHLDEQLSISGVTTNPTIITRSGKTPEEVASHMIAILRPEQKFFMQVIANDTAGIIDDAHKIKALQTVNGPEMCVKIPVSSEGYRAMRELATEDITILATAIYSADQGFLAAMNGVSYLAPYVNRMDNYGDGVREVSDLLTMLTKAQLNTRVCAASFKNVRQVHELIKAGVHAVTVDPSIIYAMMGHTGTAVAVREFSEAWYSAYRRNTFVGK